MPFFLLLWMCKARPVSSSDRSYWITTPASSSINTDNVFGLKLKTLFSNYFNKDYRNVHWFLHCINLCLSWLSVLVEHPGASDNPSSTSFYFIHLVRKPAPPWRQQEQQQGEQPYFALAKLSISRSKKRHWQQRVNSHNYYLHRYFLCFT